MAKKAGIPFSVGVQIDETLTGLAATFEAKYRLDGSADPFTNITGTFTEETPGFYSIPLTIANKGVYLVNVASTDPGVSTVSNYVVVNTASIDDINTAIATAQSDITVIKDQVGTLDQSVMDNISSSVTALDAKLSDLSILLTDESDPAITSLKELLLEIQNAGSSRDGILTTLTSFTDDVEIMLRGDEFLADGITQNPMFGKTQADIYDSLQTSVSYLHGATEDIKNIIIADAQATRDLLITKLTAIQTVVDANAAELGNVDHGLAALKTALTGLSTDLSQTNTAIEQAISNGNGTILDAITTSEGNITTILNDATNGLAAIRTAILNKLDIIEAKVDSIKKQQTTMII